MITYSTNWMGPVNMDWYRQRGLVESREHVLDENSITVKQGKNQAGDVVEHEHVTEHWCGGRIDVRGDGLGPYGDELGLPVMRGDCYQQFSDWLATVCTKRVWTLAQLVERYEKTNPKIVWARDVFGDQL